MKAKYKNFRKICVFTGTRAEYGLLMPLIKQIKNDPDLQLQILVSGMHLSQEFGFTYKEIEKDGFFINKKVEILSGLDTPVGLCKSIGLGVTGFSKAYEALKPDVIVILGDRFEAFAAAAAAMVCRIPVAHLNGGESTFGLIDEPIRHSITKMSHLHFVSTEVYKKRVIQLGENPKTVFNVGAIGLDNIKILNLLSKKELEKRLNIKFNKYNLLVTFHPVTLEKNTAKNQFQQLLDVLEELGDTNIVFTSANADTGGKIINRMIRDYSQRHKDNCMVFNSMGQLNYLSFMRFADAIVGNSSSGVIEAPSFKIGTINIGDRQAGRIKGASVIDCKPTKTAIKKAFRTLFSERFQSLIANVKNPYCRYQNGYVSVQIKEKLKKIKLKDDFIKKKFFDVNFNL